MTIRNIVEEFLETARTTYETALDVARNYLTPTPALAFAEIYVSSGERYQPDLAAHMGDVRKNRWKNGERKAREKKVNDSSASKKPETKSASKKFLKKR